MSDGTKECNLNGAVLKGQTCYLEDAPVVETSAELKGRIEENSADGKETLVFFTANWCKGCKIIKPFVKEGSPNIPPDAQILVCDAGYVDDDPCGSMGGEFIPFFKTFETVDSEDDVGWSRMFNYYLADHQVGVKTSLDSPFGGDQGLGVGIIANIQTPLMAYDVGTQLAATLHLDGNDFDSADVEAKIYSPTIGDLVPLSPVRFLGLYAGTGLQIDDGSVGMKNSAGVELLRGNYMGWLLSAEASLYEFDPFSAFQEWFPSTSLILGHSL